MRRSSMSLLEVQGLVKAFRGRGRVVYDVSFEVAPGEIVGLLGPNGAGKTTSFRMTVGMLRADAGEVRFRDRVVTRMPMYKRARLGMGYLSQEPSIFRNMTVEENVQAILETLPIGRKERAERLEKSLGELGLTRLRKSVAHQLSGGERRRLEITRSMVTEPKLMLLDEPFSGVDPIAVADIQDIVCQLRERGMGVLLTDHNVRETLSITDRAYIIYQGRILRQGTSHELVNDALVRQIYLGENFQMPELLTGEMPGPGLSAGEDEDEDDEQTGDEAGV
jgi:lipopolysaccharide export system ATP-binding protein